MSSLQRTLCWAGSVADCRAGCRRFSRRTRLRGDPKAGRVQQPPPNLMNSCLEPSLTDRQHLVYGLDCTLHYIPLLQVQHCALVRRRLDVSSWHACS